VSSTRTLLITVRGRLGDRVAAGFEGMTPVHRGGTTELVGQLVDQAQLHSLLTRIRDLGLELESVMVLDSYPTNAPHANDPKRAR
jgi:hypothetical protein